MNYQKFNQVSKKQKADFDQLDVGMTKQKLEQIHDALATMFYGCNLPFNVVDSVLFKNFIELLNPLYKPPSSKTLRTTMLEAMYEKLRRVHFHKQLRRGT